LRIRADEHQWFVNRLGVYGQRSAANREPLCLCKRLEK